VPASSLQTVVRYLRRRHAPAADGDLLRRYVNDRDADAFAELVARHGPMVLGACRRVLGDAHAAEDAFQATFLALARQARAVRRPAALPAWLYGVAVRTARHARARRDRRRQAEARARPAAVPDPLAEISGRELLAVIDEELARLPEAYRLPLLLCGLDGLARDEAAARLGWSVASLRGRLGRGRELLRQRLAARGLAVPAVLAGVLVADAAVPPALLSATVRAVLVTTAATAAGSVPALVLAVVLLAVVGTGAGLALRPDEKPAPATAPPAVAAGPRVDRYGDPLPTGAISRIGTTRLKLPAHSVVYSAVYSADSRWLATGATYDLRVWDARSGRLLHVLKDSSAAWDYPGITSVAFSPDGRWLAASQRRGESVSVWDAATGRLEHTLAVKPATKPEPETRTAGPLLAFATNSRVLFAGGRDGRVRSWDVVTWQPRADLAGPEHPVRRVSLTPDGKTLFVAHADGTVIFWDVARGRQLRTFRHADANDFWRFWQPSPDGRTYTTCENFGSRLIIRDALTGRTLHTITSDPLQVVYSSDGATVLIATRDRRVITWDARTGREQQSVQCRFDPDDNNRPQWAQQGAAFAPDGRSVVWFNGPIIRAWDLAAGAESPRLAGHRDRVSFVSFSADGGTLATASMGEAVRGTPPAAWSGGRFVACRCKAGRMGGHSTALSWLPRTTTRIAPRPPSGRYSATARRSRWRGPDRWFTRPP
jgi:RNA polymerase sigma factor (sigma-70 family)